MKVHILDQTGDTELETTDLSEVQALVDKALATGPYAGFARVEGEPVALTRGAAIPANADKVWVGPVLGVG